MTLTTIRTPYLPTIPEEPELEGLEMASTSTSTADSFTPSTTDSNLMDKPGVATTAEPTARPCLHNPTHVTLNFPSLISQLFINFLTEPETQEALLKELEGVSKDSLKVYQSVLEKCLATGTTSSSSTPLHQNAEDYLARWDSKVDGLSNITTVFNAADTDTDTDMDMEEFQQPAHPVHKAMLKNKSMAVITGIGGELEDVRANENSVLEDDEDSSSDVPVHVSAATPNKTEEASEVIFTSATPDVEADIKKKDSGVDLIEGPNGENGLDDDQAPPQPEKQKLKEIPQFYFPFGKGGKKDEREKRSDLMTKLKSLFYPEPDLEPTTATNSPTTTTTAEATTSPSDATTTAPATPQGISCAQFVHVTAACGLPRYLNLALFRKCLKYKEANRDTDASANSASSLNSQSFGKEELVDFQTFQKVWKSLSLKYFDDVSLSFGVLKKDGCERLTMDDFEVILEELIAQHPGLEFLANTPVFQARYTETVLVRLFYNKPSSSSPSMSLTELRKSKFITMLRRIEVTEDVNMTRDIFSYKHFYVIYCKFWELDTDHDLLIDRRALARYERGSMLPKVFDRVAEGGGHPLFSKVKKTLSYKDFIWFILATEDKTHPTAVEYWFRVLDTDGDGIISMHEIREFYNEQYDRMMDNITRGEHIHFHDFMCILFDIVKPAQVPFITLSDLRKCNNQELFFNMIFDLRKWENSMRRIDPAFREQDEYFIEEDGMRVRLSGWEKFAERTYDDFAADDSEEQTTSHGYGNSYSRGNQGGHENTRHSRYGHGYYDDDEEDEEEMGGVEDYGEEIEDVDDDEEEEEEEDGVDDEWGQLQVVTSSNLSAALSERQQRVRGSGASVTHGHGRSNSNLSFRNIVGLGGGALSSSSSSDDDGEVDHTKSRFDELDIDDVEHNIDAEDGSTVSSVDTKVDGEIKQEGLGKLSKEDVEEFGDAREYPDVVQELDID